MLISSEIGGEASMMFPQSDHTSIPNRTTMLSSQREGSNRNVRPSKLRTLVIQKTIVPISPLFSTNVTQGAQCA